MENCPYIFGTVWVGAYSFQTVFLGYFFGWFFLLVVKEVGGSLFGS